MSEYPKSLTPSQMISIIRYGLPKTSHPQKVIVAGAGMAGLVAASLLKDAGHDVTILEASNRVGGRVYTLRDPFTKGHYLNAGAMRIPHIHHLTWEYIHKFRLPTNVFHNITPHDQLYIKGIKVSYKDYEKNPNIFNFPVAPHERGKTSKELIQLAIQPIIQFISQDPQNHWGIIIKKLDKYSLDTFFRHNSVGLKLSPGAIEMIKVINGIEGLSELSALEILREYLIIGNPKIQFSEIVGGMDRLPRAFLPQLKKHILFHHKLTKIVQRPNQVSLYATHTETGSPYQISGNRAIITLPYSVLRLVELEPRHAFSHQKWKAIRELHYVSATKIGLQFKTRFWEKEGLYGGKTVTDLPLKCVYYPSHGFGEDGGVILASYTWEDDALIWDSMSNEKRIDYTLKFLAKIHGKQVYREFVAGSTSAWSQYPYSAGAFSMFKPEQETDLFPHIQSIEGRVHFAGEHTSTARSWIQGAIESGVRAAYEVNLTKSP